MTTLFAALARRCGLSQREAAEYLGVRIDTVQSWWRGRRSPRDGSTVLTDLAALYQRIEVAASSSEKLCTRRKSSRDTAIELGIASDDHEAQSLGWPCLGAQEAVIGLAAARLTASGYSVRVVPRGTTVATAAAIEAREALQK